MARPVAIAVAACAAAAAPASPVPCLQTPVFAHRGHPAKVENSAAALRAAATDGFGGAEVDLQPLAGAGNWALHHDLLPGRVVALPADRPLRLLSVAEWRSARFVDRDRAGGEGPATLDSALAALPARRPPGWRLVIEVKDFPTLDDLRGLVRQVERRLPLSDVVFASLSSQTLGYLRSALPPGSAVAWILLEPQVAARALGAREWQLIQTHGRQLGIRREVVQEVLDSGARVEADPQRIAKAAQALGPGLSLIVDVEIVARAPAVAAQARAAGVPLILHASIGNDRDFARLLARLYHSRGFWPQGLVASSVPAELCRDVEAHLQVLQQEAARAEEPAPGTPDNRSRPLPPPVPEPRTEPKPESAGAPYRFQW